MNKHTGTAPVLASPASVRGGFSLIEVIVAMLILAVGILATAASTGFIFTQLNDSGADTERAAAVQQVVEQLRASPFGEIETQTEGQAITVGRYRVWWTVEDQPNVKQVTIVSEGPGFATGEGMVDTKRETVVTSIVRR